ncbi:FimV/HubP family polar landmark protein [Methylotuvimicrobium sp. KM2]|uniref:FimV/HubP family polar landmark protein n=1 Tax=Methylotuvimicrobium sp. KM2 TaxID=3133976 RepID=UPI0031017703
MRKLTKSIALLSLMTPTSVLPLGIGDITLHSALNQSLDAEIALMLSPDENSSDITVKLAPPDKFDEAGLPWSYFLSKIKFNLVSVSDKRAVIKLSSTEALKEPFLDFLIEVNWPKGTLYREFTVLVDPPATYQQPVLPVPSDYGVTPAEQEYARVVERPVAPAPRREEERAPASGVYGPVGRNETLSSIASKVRPSNDVSVEQTMIALFENNPSAFYKDNINALMAGARLKVPEREVILKLSHRQALAEYGRQNQVWRGQVAVVTEAPVDEEVIDSQLRLVAPAQEDVEEAERVVSGERDDSLLQPVDPDKADRDEPSRDDAELRARLEKLEEQLAVMQQMLAIKDEQLAALQHKEPSEKVEMPARPVVTPPVKETVPPPRPAAKPPQAVAQEPVSELLDSFYYAIIALVGAGLLGGLGWLWLRKRKTEKETDTDSMFAASSQISLPSSDEELNLLAAEDESAYDVGTVGESSFLSEFTPSDFDAFDSDQHEVDPISEADVYLAYGRYQQAEGLIRQAIAEHPENDDYKLKLLEIFYANENKEGFESYANELKQAGKNENIDFWAKVAEMASEINPGSALFTDDIDTEDDVEDESAINKDSQEADSAHSADITEDNRFDFDLPEFDELESETEESPLKEEEEEAEKSDNSLDFDLESFDFSVPGSGDRTSEASKQQSSEEQNGQYDNQIEFDLSSGAEALTEEKTDASSSEEFESFDFETFDDDTEKKTDVADSSSMDEFNVSFDENETRAEGASGVTEAEKDDIGFDFNFDFDLDSTPKKGSDDSFPDDLDLGVSDLTDMDEFETKIDLARAYIDMGDSDAAKDIAQEVLDKGSSEQKKIAQSILDELK